MKIFQLKRRVFLWFLAIGMSLQAQVRENVYQGFKMDDSDIEIITIKVLPVGDKVKQFNEAEKNKPLDGRYHLIVRRNQYLTGDFKKGILNGTWEEYTDKELSLKATYKNGKPDGKEYHYNFGKLSWVYDMKDGVAQHYISYYSNGQIKTQRTYDENGKLHGSFVTFDKNGNSMEEERYEHGEREGKWLEREEKYTTTTHYKKGIQVGEYSRISVNGNIQEKGTYDENGKKTGKWIWGDENGDISTESYYQDGKLHGVAKNYFKGNKLKDLTTYSEGKRNGKTVYYREEPYLISEEYNFVNDRRHGECIQYSDGVIRTKRLYKEGTVVCEKEYDNGKLSVIRLLDERGSLVNVEQYNKTGTRTYKNTGFKKHTSIKLKQDASGIIDIEIE